MIESESRQVELVAANELLELRRRVLRGGDPDISVSDPRDAESSTQHFAIRRVGEVVAAGSFYPSKSPLDPARESYQLRYLATAPEVQGLGYGSLLLRGAETRLTSSGVSELWANGRDTAWGFYERCQWRQLPNSAHLSGETNLPHTVIYKSLRELGPWHVDFATVHDAAALASLREEMYFSVHLRETPANWVTTTERYFAEEIARQSTFVAVARDHMGEPVALAAASLRRVVPFPEFPDGNGAYIHSVSTRPAYRHRGLSRAVMEKVLAELRDRNIELVELHASWLGEGLYRSLGFVTRTAGVELRLDLLKDPSH
jgi:GNAT superfamily N-acetyltransferase